MDSSTRLHNKFPQIRPRFHVQAYRGSTDSITVEEVSTRSIIYQLTRFIIPPVRVDSLQTGNLYVRKRGGRKEFIIKKREIEDNPSGMDNLLRQIEREKKRIGRRRQALMEEKYALMLDQQHAEESLMEQAARLTMEIEEEKKNLCQQRQERRREQESKGKRLTENCKRQRKSVHFAELDSDEKPSREPAFPKRSTRYRVHVHSFRTHDTEDSRDSDCSTRVHYNGVSGRRPRMINRSPSPDYRSHHSPSLFPFDKCHCRECCPRRDRRYADQKSCRDTHRRRSIITEQPQRTRRGSLYEQDSIERYETRHPEDYPY